MCLAGKLLYLLVSVRDAMEPFCLGLSTRIVEDEFKTRLDRAVVSGCVSARGRGLKLDEL